MKHNKPILSILKNINFWGIVICNLVVGNVFLFFFLKDDAPLNFTVPLCMSVIAILVYLILFKNVNFVEKTDWKLLFYSFISCILIVVIGIFVFVIIIDFKELLTPSLLKILEHLLKSLFVVFIAIIVLSVFLIPMIIFLSIVNFRWLLHEKRDSKKNKSEQFKSEAVELDKNPVEF
jgi:hypothetical protein